MTMHQSIEKSGLDGHGVSIINDIVTLSCSRNLSTGCKIFAGTDQVKRRELCNGPGLICIPVFHGKEYASNELEININKTNYNKVLNTNN